MSIRLRVKGKTCERRMPARSATSYIKYTNLALFKRKGMEGAMGCPGKWRISRNAEGKAAVASGGKTSIISKEERKIGEKIRKVGKESWVYQVIRKNST